MPRPRLFFALALSTSLPLVVASGGCGGGDDGGSDGAVTDSSAFAAAYCALYAPCCADLGLPIGEQVGCKTLFGAVSPSDPSAVQACLDAYREQAKDAAFCSLTLPTPEPCKRAFPQQGGTSQGTAAPGQACSSTSECAPSAAGRVTCLAGSSTCRVLTHAKAGAACNGDVWDTSSLVTNAPSGDTIPVCYRDDGLTCEAGTCAEISAVGGTCTSDGTCATGAYCASGTCAAKVGPGASCAGSSGACDATSYCDQLGTKKCEARIAEGGACDTNDQCTTGYCYPDKCAKRQGGLKLLPFCQ